MKSLSPGGGNDLSEVFTPSFTADRNSSGVLTAEWKLEFPADSGGKAWQESNRVWVNLADGSGDLLYCLFFMPCREEDSRENFNIEFSRGGAGKSLVPLQHAQTEAAVPAGRRVTFRVELYPVSASGGDGVIRVLYDAGNGFSEYIRVQDETYSEFAKLQFIYKTGKKDQNYHVLVDDIRVYAGASVPRPGATLSAEPLSVNPGESFTLSWTSENAGTLAIAPGIGTVAAEGSLSLSPSETVTYTLTATGPGGTVSRSVTVTVSEYPAPEVSLSAEPADIKTGDSFILSWVTQNATDVSIAPGIGTVAAEGSLTLSPPETVTYTLTATGPGGTVSRNVTVTVTGPPLPAVSLTAVPGVITEGESAVLTWASENGDSAVMDQGTGAVPLLGSLTVTPAETLTYAITVTGPGGTASAEATVTVTPPAVPAVSITADPETVIFGGISVLTWTAENAHTCSIEPDIGPVPVSGSVTVSPDRTTDYIITATGQGGSASARVTVTVKSPVTPQPEGSFGSKYNDLIPPDTTKDSYDYRRFSVITGLVHDMSGSPLPDVRVRSLRHPEYGTALTDTEGRFSLPVEGGSTMTAVFEHDSRITSHRQVYVPWND